MPGTRESRVAMVDGHGACRQVAGLRVFSERHRTAWRTGELVPGRPMILAEAVRRFR